MLHYQKPDQFVIANAQGGSNLVDLHIGGRHAIARDDAAFYFKQLLKYKF